jgi:putative ABC transport system permease protein
VAPVAADEAEQRVSNLSRAYRVNLTVLALVALFVGAFLVFSVVSLSVAQRTPAFALLGVLGLTRASAGGWCCSNARCSVPPAARWACCWAPAWPPRRCAFWPAIWAAATSRASRRRCSGTLASTLAFAALGTASAVAGGWWPARQAEAIAPAQALKGLGTPDALAPPAWPGLALLAVGVAAAFAPPIAGLPLAAYVAVAALLFGGVALVPAVVHACCWPRRPCAAPAAAGPAARALSAPHGHGGGGRRGGQPGAFGGADGDGGELSLGVTTG